MENCVDVGIDALLALGADTLVPLSTLTSFQVGGAADLVLTPADYGVLAEAVRICTLCGIPYTLLGKGTNVLAADDGFRGLILRFDTPTHPPVWEGTTVTVCAGTSLLALARESVQRGLSGLERLCGIPGTVGGACAMNAGAYGAELKDVLRRVRVLRQGEIQWLDVGSDDMGYRCSRFSFPACIVLEAALSLQKDDGTALATLRDCMQKRREKQPLEFPSAGSTFKRPQGYFAGALIEQCGLKGYRIGGAQVSEKHAGFVVNVGDATAADVSALIAHIQATVFKSTGVLLECEIKRIGEELCIY